MSDRLQEVERDVARAASRGGGDPPGTANGEARYHSGLPDDLRDEPQWSAFASRYEVQQPLRRLPGRDVGLAVDRVTGRSVQITRLHAAGGDDFEERFLDRARRLAALDHPRLLRPSDYGRDDFGCWLVTEAAEMECLADLLADCGALDVDTVGPLACQLSGALAAYHDGGLTHARVTPENILIDDAGDPRLTDGDLVEPVSARPRLGSSSTSRSADPFAPPELRSGGTADFRSDVWSLGAVLLRLLTGLAPEEIDTARIPESLRPVLMRALDRNPLARFVSAAEFHRSLCAALGMECEVQFSSVLPTAERSVAAPPSVTTAETATEAPTAGARPAAASTGRAGDVPSFGRWYAARFAWTQAAGAGPSYLIQALLWTGLGFLWIPAWYLGGRQSSESSSGP